MIWGIQVMGQHMEAKELVELGRRIFEGRFELPATHAEIHAGDGPVAVEGLVVREMLYVQKNTAIVGIVHPSPVREE